MSKDVDSHIHDMIKSFKTMKDLQEFTEAQHSTIMELTRKVQSLTEKNKHMENLLQQQVPVLVSEYKPPTIVGPNDQDHEEAICRMELKKLHDLSIERALTFEETKKVEVYTKLLISLSQKPKSVENIAKGKTTTELLRLVGSDNEQ